MRAIATRLRAVSSYSDGILMAHYDRPNSFIPSWRTFSRSSAATRFGPTGFPPETIATGNPRFDYAPNTPFAAQGLLMEGPRTNLFLNSATLVTQNVTTSAQAYTLSFYGTGTVTLTGASTAGPLVGTGTSNRVALTFTPTAGTLTCTVSGSVTYAQLEAGSFASSWIPTTGGAANRVQETCTGLVANEHGAGQGSKAIRFTTGKYLAGPSQVLWTIDSGDPQNKLLVYRDVSGVLYLQIRNSGGAYLDSLISSSTTSVNTTYDLAIKWGNGLIQAQVAGSAPGAQQAQATPPGLTTAHLGLTPADGGFPWFGTIKRELSAKTALPLSQLLARIAA